MTAITTLQSSAGVGSPSSTASPNVAEASQEFESVLLGQWLKDSADSFGSVPGSEDDDVGASQIKEFGMQHLAAAITKSGGIGIAKIVEGALVKAAGLHAPATDGPQSGARQATTHRKESGTDGER